MDPEIRAALHRGLVIPASPLALNSRRQFDERRQRALVRYYLDAGAGGLAVGVHTTQFAIREPKHGLFQPLLELVADEISRAGEGEDQRPYRQSSQQRSLSRHDTTLLG